MSQHRFKRHAYLVDRMASARGIDLQEAALRGDVSPAGIADLVLSCADCKQARACDTWLGERVGTVSATPQYCRNARAFNALAAQSS